MALLIVDKIKRDTTLPITNYRTNNARLFSPVINQESQQSDVVNLIKKYVFEMLELDLTSFWAFDPFRAL